MSDQLSENPYVLPINAALYKYLTSSIFLPNNIWKTTFSPCSHYLAIPKQNIYGHDCIVIIYCPNWHAKSRTDELYVHAELLCSSPVWSLAFGQSKANLLNETGVFKRRCSSQAVNHRYDLTKNLFLAAGLADGKINIWNINTGELTLILTDHRSTVCSLAFTSDTMQLASCSHDKTIKLWDLLDDGNMYQTLKEKIHVMNTVKWSPDGKLLGAVGPLVMLYDAINWEERFQSDRHEHSVTDCAFSSDSVLFATASCDTRACLWSTITGELLKEFFHQIPVPLKIYAGGDNGSFVRSIVFTKYNQFLITACDDNQVRWFSIDSSSRRDSIWKQSQANVLSLAMESNGETLAVGTRTGEVHLWSMQSIGQLPSLKSFCRMTTQSHWNIQRKELLNLPLSKHLINYLLYKDIQVK